MILISSQLDRQKALYESMEMIKLSLLGENYGQALFIEEGMIVEFRDSLFKKQVEFTEEFESMVPIQISDTSFFGAATEENDKIFTISPFPIGALPTKNLTQNLGQGTRKIEVFQGQDLGNIAVRISFTMGRSVKWKIYTDYEYINSMMGVHTFRMNPKVMVTLHSTASPGFEQNYFYFALPMGYSEMIFFFQSEMDFERISKNLLVLDPNDISTLPVREQAPAGTSIFPIITYVSLGTSDDRHQEVQNYLTIGSILIGQRRQDYALEYLQKALNIVQNEIGDPNLEMEILIKMGTAYGELEQYETALNIYQMVSNILHQLGNTAELITNYLAIGNILLKLGRYQDALSYFKEVYNHFPEIVLKKISACYIGMGNKDEAVRIRRQLLEQTQANKDKGGEALALMDLGEVLVLVGRVGEAMSMYEQAIRIRKSMGDNRGIAESLNMMAKTLYSRGKFVKAKKYFERAIEAYENLGMVMESQNIRRTLEKMVLKPFVACQFCTATCSLDLMGLAYTDANDPAFKAKIREILKSALKSRNMKEIAEAIFDKAGKNIFLQGLTASKRQLAYCISVYVLEELLSRLSPEQRGQFGNLIQTELRRIIM
ncbi:MAG: tetratricopeptide repeat protein [Candidatus Helarchaeota archaeon]